MKIKLRHFNIFKDFMLFSHMMQKEWPLGRHVTGRKILGGILYALDVISVSNFLITAVDPDNRPVGFSGADLYHKAKGMRAKCAKYLMYLIVMTQPKKIRDVYKKFYAAEKARYLGRINDFDAELSIMIVDQNARGNKIGQKLFETVCYKIKNSGGHKMVIETDNLCNWRFYEAVGCQRIASEKNNQNTGAACSEEYFYLYNIT